MLLICQNDSAKTIPFLPFSGESLSCYRCGTLDVNARKIQDCQGPNTVEECAPNEACVVFKRLYKKGSGKDQLQYLEKFNATKDFFGITT